MSHKHFHFLYIENIAWCALYIDDNLQTQGYFKLKEVEEYLKTVEDTLNITVTSSSEPQNWFSVLGGSCPLTYVFRDYTRGN
jgi:hypothetical protein